MSARWIEASGRRVSGQLHLPEAAGKPPRTTGSADESIEQRGWVKSGGERGEQGRHPSPPVRVSGFQKSVDVHVVIRDDGEVMAVYEDLDEAREDASRRIVRRRDDRRYIVESWLVRPRGSLAERRRSDA